MENQVDEESRAALFERARSLAAAGDLQGADEVLARASALFPGSAQARAERARLAKGLSATTQATAEWLAAVGLSAGREPIGWWSEAAASSDLLSTEGRELVDRARASSAEAAILLLERQATQLLSAADHDSALAVLSELVGLLPRSSGKAEVDRARSHYVILRTELDNSWVPSSLTAAQAQATSKLIAEPRASWDRGIPQVAFWLFGREPTATWGGAVQFAEQLLTEERWAVITSDIRHVLEMILAPQDPERASQALVAAWNDLSLHLLTLLLRWSPASGEDRFPVSADCIDEILARPFVDTEDAMKRFVLVAVYRPWTLRQLVHDFDDSLSGGSFQVSLGQLRELDHPLPFPGPVSMRPTVAVCVSGQLRGFEAAARSHDFLRLEEVADVSTFVHTWKEVGRPLPSRRHAARAFEGPVLEQFAALVRRHGDEIWATMPSLRDWFRESATANRTQLAQVYGVADSAVEIEDEADERFSDFTNTHKMLWKIAACHRLAVDSGGADFYLRVRPDRSIAVDSAVDWPAVFTSSASERTVFADLPMFGFWGWLGMGDQFAVGTEQVMGVYASTFESLQTWTDETWWGRLSPRWVGHRPLASHLLSRGIVPRSTPGLRLGSYSDAPRPTLEQLEQRLTLDVEASPKGPGQALLDVVRAELRAREDAEKGT